MTETQTTLHVRPDDWTADVLEYWCVPLGGTQANVQRITLSSLRDTLDSLGPISNVIVWLPAHLVLELTPTVPAKSASQVAERVPYAIEESLSGDLEEEHIALGSRLRQAEGQWQTPVRVVRLHRLRQLLQVLRDVAGLEPDAVYAESDALPAKPGDIQLWLEVDRTYLRHPDGRWQAGRIDQLDETLAQWTQSTQGELGLWVLATASDRLTHEALIEPLRKKFVSLRWQLTEPHPLAWLSARERATAAINLLQGSLASTRRVRPDWRAWRWPVIWAATAATLIVVIDVTITLRDRALTQQLNATLTEWREVLTEAGSIRESQTPLSLGLAQAVAIQAAWPDTSLASIEAKDSTITIALQSGATIAADSLRVNLQNAISQQFGDTIAASLNIAQTDQLWLITTAQPSQTDDSIPPSQPMTQLSDSRTNIEAARP